MLFEQSTVFTKENLDVFLKELGKEFRKLNGTSMPAEIILIGGAAILASYGFREMTTDVDAIIHASTSMKDAINRVADKFGLPNGWLNSDFTHTSSFSPRLDEVSVYYKTFSNVLQVRTVSAEYLIAMKLCSGRKYKNDLSDIIGILYEHQKSGTPISMDSVSKAVTKLYGGWDDFSQDSKEFIKVAFEVKDYKKFYIDNVAEEKRLKDTLIGFEKSYPGATTESNVNDILASLKKKKPSVRQQLQELSEQSETVPREKSKDKDRER